MPVNLLEFSNGGGCGCKVDPLKLKQILGDYNSGSVDKILVDLTDRDDASVIEINSDFCLIQTLDFFLPIVNNPYDFGKIAAANALSDVYAMGGAPITALSILGWPEQKLPIEFASQILEGAESICNQVGISISGGHTVNTKEPLFGLSVNGTVKKEFLKRKNTCKIGDYLYITKPLGIGLLSNALQNDTLSEEGYSELLEITCKLNILGTELGTYSHVTAMTDITGFGFLGHLSEMLTNNRGAEVFLDNIPVIPNAIEIAKLMKYPNITTSNYNYIKDRTDGLNGVEFLWLCDPQTSGGLLFSSSEEMNIDGITLIGRVITGNRIKLV
ncbi:MAG: selenide, water dikinase SelD [Bacteroidia bacterium]